MSTLTRIIVLVFLSFSFSISSGLLFLRSGHALLHGLGVPGFTLLPSHTSNEIGVVGGIFTALPVLAMRSIPSDLIKLLGCSCEAVLLPAVVAIGAAQGYVGGKMWERSIYTVIDGQELPGVLGARSASLAGAIGALCHIAAGAVFVISIVNLSAFLSPEGKCRRERARPLDPVSPEPSEVEQSRG